MFFESKFCEWEEMHRVVASYKLCNFVINESINIHKFGDLNF